MTCLDFENRVHELLDHRQSELPDELSAHAARCAACQKLWGELLQLEHAIAAWQVRTPPSTVALADTVLLRLPIKSESPADTQIVTTRPACSPMAGFVVLLASCAALLIALGIGWRVSSNAMFANRQSLSATRTAVATNHSESATSAVPVTDRQLDVLLHDARDAYVALASQAWQEVSTADLLLPPTDTSTPFRVDDSAVGVPDSLSVPLAPYGRDLRDAVDSWLQQVFQNQDSAT
ncbi:MAG: hypothetical protein ACKV2Q_35525 [Planctomycetaceae bacterium]